MSGSDLDDVLYIIFAVAMMDLGNLKIIFLELQATRKGSLDIW
jgi:hypothetical protein